MEESGDIDIAGLLARVTGVLRSARAFEIACRAAIADWHEPVDEHDGDFTTQEIEGAVAERMPDEAAAWASLPNECLEVAAVLARSINARRIARENEELASLVYDLAETNQYAAYLERILDVLDDEELVVIHPALERGYRVRITGITDNFQLHTLLADALVGDPAEGWIEGERPDPRAVAAAQESDESSVSLLVKGQFHMEGWGGLAADGSLGRADANPKHWIWGDGDPADIPKLDGVRVVLLGPLAAERTWSVGLRPVARAGLRVTDRLSAEETRRWLDRILSSIEGR